MAALLIIPWLVCSFLAFHVFAHWWTNTVDWTTEQRWVFGVISVLLGPAALLVALILWAIDGIADPHQRYERTYREHRVIKRSRNG